MKEGKEYLYYSPKDDEIRVYRILKPNFVSVKTFYLYQNNKNYILFHPSHHMSYVDQVELKIPAHYKKIGEL